MGGIKLRSLLPGLFISGILSAFALGMPAEAFSSGELVPERHIRVAVLKDAREFRLSVRGPYQLIDPSSGTVLSEGRRLKESWVGSTPTGMKVGDFEFPVKLIRILTGKDIVVDINNRARHFRGEIDIIKDSKGNFLVVNSLGIEEYVRGVLYHEVSHRWPMEALKAQAVAARTYALDRMGKNIRQPFDVTSDIYSQVYGRKSAERYRTNIAVRQTEGRILTYRGKILPAYFHAACGGHTENAGELWNEDLPPLKGVPCPFCSHSPHSSWKRNFRLKDIQDKLNAKGYNLGLIKEINVTQRNQSGRIKKVEIVARDGRRVTISGKDFRAIVGPNDLKSNHYEIILQGYYVDMIGQGWGHGVGLCQWGTLEMSRQKYSYSEILQYYYPGTEIVDCRIIPAGTAKTNPKNKP
ncbi:MAG: SpoIID/LytB domain-containing protein [Candidatus Omnitrophota bacterium]